MRFVFPLAQLAVVLLALDASAQGEQIIAVPPGPGNTSDYYPFLIHKAGIRTMRYQQVYAASAFAALEPTNLYLTRIDFWLHPGGWPQGGNSATNLQMRLSTTSKAPDALSMNFAENVGPDEMLVFNVPGLTISMRVGEPVPFIFPKPFLYRPANGNLLLDVRIGVSESVDMNEYALDANYSPTDSVSRVYAMSATATQATASDTVGLITTFHFNPVPSLQSEFHRVYAGTLSNMIVIRWPSQPSTFVVQTTDRLGSKTSWHGVTNRIYGIPQAGDRWIEIPATSASAAAFYRLVWPSGQAIQATTLPANPASAGEPPPPE